MGTREDHPDAVNAREFFARVQDENGVDLTQVREMLRLSPIERLRRAERMREESLRLVEIGRRHRERRKNSA